MRRLAVVVALTLPLVLAGCLEPKKAALLEKAEGVETKTQLRDRLGDPDDVSKLGPIETWTYKAADGTVSFLIAGDTVTMSSTGEAPAQR
ncbi:MAG: hypothetical protein WCZ23_11720 [Rhodospirillaceae bacterium]